MAWLRAALLLVVAGTVASVLLSGDSPADPHTPTGLPGQPPPFLGTAVVGSGGLTASIDAYGDVVDLRPAAAGPALIDNPAARQAAGSVSAETGIVPLASLDGRGARPLWTADSVAQRYRLGTNVAVTEARFGVAWVRITYAAGGTALACLTSASEGVHVSLHSREPAAERRLHCDDQRARRIVRGAESADRRWLSGARPLGDAAPTWAEAMYRRSLLVLRALADRRSGAVAAGARDGWAYVWPRDAGAAALALTASGYRAEARRAAGFLLELDLGAAARFRGDGTPVPGRAAQGDAGGWTAVAARASGLSQASAPLVWRDLADYQEGAPGDYLANAIAAQPPADGPKTPLYGGKSARRPWIALAFGGSTGLKRRAGDPQSGLDSAAAWAVRPFSQPALFPAVRRTLLGLAAGQTRFGIAPSGAWPDADPWTAPTAWTAWSLAALGERRAALGLLGNLRRAATPAGALPERVDARTGIPRSTTPLAWSHAFAILALRQLWP